MKIVDLDAIARPFPAAVLAALPVRHQGRDYALLHGDALQLLWRLPAGSVNLICADPPYFLSNGGTTCHAGQRASVDKGSWDASKGLEADHLFHVAWLRGCARLLQPTGSLWVSATHHAIFSIGFALQQLHYQVINCVTWEKPNPPPNLSCRSFTHSTELLLWAAPSGRRHVFNYLDMKQANGGKQMKDVWTITAPPPSEKLQGKHPTQKPVALLERMILASSKPGDLVFDPFNGSGTAALAALRHHRRYVGLDRTGSYLDLTERRIVASRAGR